MLIVKALHLIAIIAWFAGLLYLPRLFVYHASCADQEGRQRFALMEARLYWRIMLPAMLLTLFFGLVLMSTGISGSWLAVKLLFVALLLGFHISLFLYMKRLVASSHPSARFFRFYNEIPALLLIVIVSLAVIKPF